MSKTPIKITRIYEPDMDAMVNALKLVLTIGARQEAEKRLQEQDQQRAATA